MTGQAIVGGDLCLSYTLFDVARDYINEHCRKTGVDVKRAAQALRDWLMAIDPQTDPTKLTRAHGRQVVDHIIARGCASSSARRIMTFGVAALNHARKEERLAKVPTFQMPDAAAPRIRWLTRDEHRRLMLQPMPGRLRRFFILAFATGARSRAIEELKWEQVSLADRTIAFATPGKNHKNKRRPTVPISDELLPRLEAMYATRKDEYVIGLGPRGACSTTYHLAKDVLAAIGIREKGVARHVARHTFASWLLQQGVSIYEVAKLLGDTVTMVEKVYGHMQPKHLLAAVNRLH